MKHLMIALILTLLPGLTLAVVPTTQSAGGLASDDSINTRLETAPIMQTITIGNVANTAAKTVCGCFEIFDVWVGQSEDFDGDGYHRKISVEFDADTSNARETVYAKLYLRRDAGPWLLYAETGLFDIRYDSAADIYRIDTRLLEGFPPDRYELLIELHALYHTGVVASYSVNFDQHGDLLRLEDSTQDKPVVDVIISPEPPPGEVVIVGEGSIYAGSLTPGWILALGLLLSARRKR